MIHWKREWQKFVPILYLLWTIINLLEITNGCFGIVQGVTDDLQPFSTRN